MKVKLCALWTSVTRSLAVSMASTVFRLFVALALASSLAMATDFRNRGRRIVDDVGSIPAEVLPIGWRFPNEAELRDRGEKIVQISADFNGDGVHDEAILLKREDSRGEGLWVWLSGSNRTRRWINLDTIRWDAPRPNAPLEMAIEAVLPGTYPHGCFFGFLEGCNPGAQRRLLTLHDLTIVYYRTGAASMYVWSKNENDFKRVWSSD